MLVPRMDLGAIPLTLRFDGSTATYPAALQEVLFVVAKSYSLRKSSSICMLPKRHILLVTPKDVLCQ